jgi:hypothetical protein
MTDEDQVWLISQQMKRTDLGVYLGVSSSTPSERVERPAAAPQGISTIDRPFYLP